MNSCPSKCNACGGKIQKKLCDDEPGCNHTYIYACSACFKEYGTEWLEKHPLILAKRRPIGSTTESVLR